MLVQQILRGKAVDGVVTLSPDSKVSAAAGLLAERRIGAVVVSSDGTAADGILSERDIVRELAAHGGGCLDATVAAYMTSELQTCARNDDARAVLERMTEGRFRHMPVVEDGKLVGLITLGDVVKARLSELSMEKDALEGMIMGH